MIRMGRLSTRYIYVDLTSPDDLSGMGHGIAFPTRGALPAPTDLLPAEYVAVGPHSGPAIRHLVGPDNGGTNLGPGDYDIYPRVLDSLEVEYEPVDSLVIA